MVHTIIFNSTTVVTGSNNSRYRFNLAQTTMLKRGSYVGVQAITMPYSWFNITSANGNNTFSALFPTGAAPLGATLSVTVPDGFYTLAQLNAYFQFVMIANNYYLINSTGQYVYYAQFVYNTTSYDVEIDTFGVPTALPAGYTAPSAGWGGGALPATANTPQIVIPATNSIGSIIGFSAGTYPPAQQTATYSVLSDLTPNLTPINSLIMQCNLVNNPYSQFSRTLYSFTPNVGFGSNIDIQNSYPAFVSIQEGYYGFVEIEFVDQNYRPITINDPNLCIQLVIRDPDETV